VGIPALAYSVKVEQVAQRGGGLLVPVHLRVFTELVEQRMASAVRSLELPQEPA
jgi:hypothetical protein